MLGLFGLMATTLAVAYLVLPFWSFIRVTRLTREVQDLKARLTALERERATSPAPHAATVHTARADAPTAVPMPPADGPATTPADVTPTTAIPVDTPRSPVVPTPPPASFPDVGGTDHVTTTPLPAEPAPPAAPSWTPAPATASSVPEADDLEARVGGRWLLYTGVAILLIGVSFFLKYAFDNAWIDERGRVVLGVVSGLALVAAGMRISASLDRFGQALAGTGIVTLYLSAYAAFEFYALVGVGTAFAGMVAATLLGVALADRLRSPSLATIAAFGGYGTPFLVNDGSSAAARLFSYDLLLGLGALVLLKRHGWLVLPRTAYALTVLTLLAWAADRYTSDQWAIVLGFLTAFVVLFTEMRRVVAQSAGTEARFVTALLWTAPVLYHAAAVAVTFDHPPALQVYLIVATAVGIVLTAHDHRGWLRALLVVASYLPLFAYLDTPRGPSWLLPNIVTVVALAGMHVMALVDRTVRQEERWSAGDGLALHAAVIGAFGLLNEMLLPGYTEWRGGAAALLAMGSAGLWFFLTPRDALAALNAAGLSFTMVALALAVQFEGPVVAIGWAVEGAVAAWMGLRAGHTAFRYGGLVLLMLAAGQLADAFASAASLPVVVNSRTAAVAVFVVLAYALATLWRRDEALSRAEGVVPVTLQVVASVFTMAWLSVEIDAYWATRAGEPQARLSEELMRSLAWGSYGAAVVVVGLWRSIVSLRWIGMAAIGLTVLKVFLVDLSQLGGIYRVVGFLVVGVLLVGVSYLYQRTRQTKARPDQPG